MPVPVVSLLLVATSLCTASGFATSTTNARSPTSAKGKGDIAPAFLTVEDFAT